MSTILFKNATLLDIYHRNVPNRCVLVEGKKITAVESQVTGVRVDKVVDAQGKTLMPGLIDAHLHLGFPTIDLRKTKTFSRSYITLFAAKMAAVMISQGFTTVRDACGVDAGFVQAIDEGLFLGPRVFFADKMITKTGGHSDDREQHVLYDSCPCHTLSNHYGIVADGIAAVQKATREILRRGATQIKIATSGGVMTDRNSVYNPAFSKQEITAIVEEAQDAGTYVMAHAHGEQGILRAIECGVRSIEHGSFLTGELAELMHQYHTYLVPTLFMAKQLAETPHLSEHIQQKSCVVLSAMKQSVQLARRYRLNIGFGSDAFGESIVDHAQEFLIRGALEDPYDLIISATATNAEIMQQQDKLGVIKPGALADLILVEGDPLSDLSLLCDREGKSITMVMKGGEILKGAL